MKQMKNKKERGITLIALVVTIIVLIVLAGISINLIFGNLGIVTKEKEAKEENLKQTAKEIMNLKITSIQIENYTENKTLPSLQFLADKLCEDNDMEYVLTQSKAHASLDKINTTNLSSIYTKLKEYPYEFEINDSLQLASIDGVKVADNKNGEVTLSKEQYDSILNRLSALENTNLVSNNNYSSEEQVTGKWIDGKPLYRKVYTYTGAITENTKHVLDTVSFDIDRLIKADITTKNSIGTQLLPGTYVEGGAVHATAACFDKTNKQFYIISDGSWPNMGATIIFEYTKLNDSNVNS